MNKGNLQAKVIRLVLTVSLSSILAVGLVAVIALYSTSGTAIKTEQMLGKRAAEDSSELLIEQAQLHITEVARSKSEIIEQRFTQTKTYVTHIADVVTNIYRNPELYTNRMLHEPDRANTGRVTAYIMYSAAADRGALSDEAAKLSNIQDFLIETVLHDKVVTGAYIATEDGIVIMADDRPESRLNSATGLPDPYEAFERPWYKLASDNQELGFTDAMPDKTTGNLGIVCAAPFYKNERLAGVAGVGSFLIDINDLVLNTEVGSEGYAFIVNESNKVIISPREEGESAPNQIFRLPENRIEEMTVDGSRFFLAYHPMETLGWRFVTVIPEDEVLAPVKDSNAVIAGMTEEAGTQMRIAIRLTLTVLVVLVVVTALISINLSIRWAEGLTCPLQTLTEGAGIISGGNLDHVLAVKTGDEIELLADTFNTMVGNIKRITSEKERIGAELNIAAQIQASMLPRIFPPFPERKEFDIYASMLPAKEVGGDFYDFFFVDDNTLAIIIADVSGKGVPAALFMVIAKTLIKNNAQSGMSPKEVFETVNNLLCENNEANMFVTAFMCYLDIPTGKLTFINAGHNPPLVRRGGTGYERLKIRPGFVLAGMEDMFYKQDEIMLSPGDELFMYTDGVTEAVNNQMELFSDQKLLEVANSLIDCRLKEFLVSLKQEIDRFAEGAEQADDITMLALRYGGGKV